MIKCSISAGTYTLPYAVQRLGITVALLLVALMAFLSTVTIEMLLEAEVLLWNGLSKEERAARRAKRRPLTLSELAAFTFPDFGCEVHAPHAPHAPHLPHLPHIAKLSMPHVFHAVAPGHGDHGWDHEHHAEMHTTLDGEKLEHAGGVPRDASTGARSSASPASPVGVASVSSTSNPVSNRSPSPTPLGDSATTPPLADAAAGAARDPEMAENVAVPRASRGVPHNPYSLRVHDHAADKHLQHADDPHFHQHHHHYPFLNLLAGVVASSMIIMSVGAVAVYIVFVMTVLPTAMPAVTPSIAVAGATALIGALALVPDLRWLAFTSVLGTISETTGIAAVLAMGFSGQGVGADGALHADEVPLGPGSVMDVFALIGTLAFLFGNHTTAIPVFQTLAHRQQGPAILRTAYAVDALVNGLFAVFAALLFSSATRPNVIENLGTDSPIIAAVKILMCVDLCLTSPLIIASGREIVENIVARMPIAQGRGKIPFFLIVRLGMVLIALVIALKVPSFPTLITLMGGLVGCAIAFIVPPLLLLRLHLQASTLYKAALWATVAFGAVAVVGATTAGLSEA